MCGLTLFLSRLLPTGSQQRHSLNWAPNVALYHGQGLDAEVVSAPYLNAQLIVCHQSEPNIPNLESPSRNSSDNKMSVPLLALLLCLSSFALCFTPPQSGPPSIPPGDTPFKYCNESRNTDLLSIDSFQLLPNPLHLYVNNTCLQQY
jgi:hypothetical protein